SRQAQDTLAAATAYASEAIGATRTLQAFNAEAAARDRFSAAVEDAYGAARGAIRARSFLTGFAIAMIFGSVVAVLWFGARDVLSGTLSAGTLGQFLLYAVFAAGSLGALSEVWGELSQAAGAAERLTELLEEPAVITAPAAPVALPVPPQGALSFEDVHFSYPARPGYRSVNGLSFSVTPGETVAIVGPSGAGKSTILSLMLRFYDPESGRITLDGIDLRATDPGELRRRI